MAKPKLRFPEFTDEWEEKQFDEILSENLDPIPTPKEEYIKLGIYCHAKGTFHKIVKKDEGLDVDTMYIVHKDNLIVNITFAWEHAIAITTEKDEGKIVSHRFPTYSFKEGQYSWFYHYLILDKRMEYNLMIASPGGAGRNRVLNKIQFLKISSYIPLIGEQQKIADFLSKIDEKIANQEAVVSDHEEMKKGLMQKIFSQEVRFKADDGSEYPEWEEKRLEETVEFLDGKRKPLEKGERQAGQYPYYGASGIIDYVKDYIFDEELILLSEDGANIVDRNYRVCFLARGKYWVNNHAHVLKALDENNNYFICEQLESLNYIKYNTGTAQPKLNQEVCRNIKLKCLRLKNNEK